ncbi:MAG: hypothetical protein BMS9Abin08_1359 [Gammaproteobacteria bacterium]|nr:MAG: hypothetical protein BMS9Abin08_1359 [Gammaproteobacteria bacterium]
MFTVYRHPSGVRGLNTRQAEHGTHIVHRNNLVAKIDDTEHMRGRTGHRLDHGTAQHLLHIKHIDAVGFIIEGERQALNQRIVVYALYSPSFPDSGFTFPPPEPADSFHDERIQVGQDKGLRDKQGNRRDQPCGYQYGIDRADRRGQQPPASEATPARVLSIF